jgi:hypothetical protein
LLGFVVWNVLDIDSEINTFEKFKSVMPNEWKSYSSKYRLINPSPCGYLNGSKCAVVYNNQIVDWETGKVINDDRG